MKIALISTDNREHLKRYDLKAPILPPPQEALLSGFAQLPDLEVHFVSCLQKTPVSSPTKLADNIFYHPLYVPNIGWMKTGYQGCIRAVRRLLRKIQPDIVHGQGTERECAMCAVFSGFPNVLTIHGNMRLVAQFLRARPFSYYWLATRLERLCLGNTGGVVAISTYTNDNVEPYTKRTWLLPNPVHSSYFNVIRAPSSKKIIFCAATIGERKNQLGLIDALRPLQSDFDFELRFAGPGQAYDPYVKKFKDEVSGSPWCIYLGALNRGELQRELAVAHAAVLPSFEDNCPMVILEAAAAGVPFAASSVGGIPDLIRAHETGFLFDPHSSVSIRSVFDKVLRAPEDAEKIALSARREAQTRFAPKVIAQKHVEIYRQVVTQ